MAVVASSSSAGSASGSSARDNGAVITSQISVTSDQRRRRNRARAASGGGGVPAPAVDARPAAARARTGRAVPRPARRRELQIRVPLGHSHLHSPDSPNCITSVIQWTRYIQMLAEWVVAAKAAAMRRSLALLLVPALALAPAACRQQPEGALKVVVIGARTEASRSRARAACRRPTRCCSAMSPRVWSGSTPAATSSPVSPSAGTSATTG